MIKLKVIDITNLIAHPIFNEKLNAKGAFLLSKLGKELDSQFKTFMETRDKLFESLNVTIGENKQLIVPTEHQEEFTRQFNELLNTEIELNVNKLPLSLLDKVQLSAIDIISMESIIDEEA